MAVLSGIADHVTDAKLETPEPAVQLIELLARTVKITGPVAFVTGLISIDINAGVAPDTPTGNKVLVTENAEEVLLAANVLANGPLIKVVLLGVPLNNPEAIAVPNLNIFEDVVLIIPDVIVSVPLIDNGTFNDTPVAFELLIVRDAILAVDVVAFR